MGTVAVDASMLERVLAQRDALVQAITRAGATQEWEAVMAAFDGLLGALKALEASLERDGLRDVASPAQEES